MNNYQDIISLSLQGMVKDDIILQEDIKEITGILRERMKTAKARKTQETQKSFKDIKSDEELKLQIDKRWNF